MEHILKLRPKYFDYINNGTKRIEMGMYYQNELLRR